MVPPSFEFVMPLLVLPKTLEYLGALAAVARVRLPVGDGGGWGRVAIGGRRHNGRDSARVVGRRRPTTVGCHHTRTGLS